MMHLMEAMFDVAYLGVVTALGIRLLFEKGRDAKMYGLMAIILGLGDAFHLVPRVVSHLSVDGFERYASALSWGEMVTGITMTLFYVLFYHYYAKRSNDNAKIKKLAIYLLAAARIVLVLLPQNMWGKGGSYLFGIIRNIPFAIMGLLLIIWSFKHRKKEGLAHTAVLIAASFIFYIPVVVGVRYVPALGALMIPKTIAYVLLVVAGYRFFIKGAKPVSLLKTAAVLLATGLVGGVFYREFTKYYDYTGRTALSLVHLHLIVLGFVLFLALYAVMQNENDISPIKKPITLYITGLSWTVVAFVVRGIYTVTAGGAELFSDAALSGMAGLGHCILAVGALWTVARLIGLKTRRENND